MQSGYKIIEAEIKNFKSIDFKRLELDGRSFIIQGGNGKGKTSIIQALLCTITGQKVPAKPIKDGTDGAEIEVLISDGDNHYKIRNTYTEKPDGTIVGKLQIKDHEGRAVNKSVFHNIIGKGSIDIFSDFLQQKTQKQVEILKQLSGVGDGINALNLKRQEVYEKRTEVNKEIGKLEAFLSDKQLPEVEPREVKDEEIESKQSELRNVEATQEKWRSTYQTFNSLLSQKAETQKRIEQADGDVAIIEKQIQDLLAKKEAILESKQSLIDSLPVLEERLLKGQAWYDKNPEPPKATEIIQEIEALKKLQKEGEDYITLESQWRELNEKKKQSQDYTADIKKIDQDKIELIAGSSIPVKGLTFSEDGVFLDGLPFEDGQINTAKIIEVGMAVACAMNPTLQVMRVDGSLLDKNTFKTVAEYAKANGMQVIYEVVDWEAGDEQIKYVESVLEKIK